ncbi:hypothetical protein [Spartinivicinus poritis]|uniref:Uncharacterized protein n=1 Tax=Spartinivicinus poritis TaxID=2994640 RepID=A0ABT5UDG9_9GAMM|nr:hypothetical protein [Spartinivicinus sp. A2-2]MDE1464422.1 hypothetical protein [Spartinivicinus sp. A2-2]
MGFIHSVNIRKAVTYYKHYRPQEVTTSLIEKYATTLYQIFSLTHTNVNFDNFKRKILPRSGTDSLALFYNDKDRIIGFTVVSINLEKIDKLKFIALGTSIYFDLQYKPTYILVKYFFYSFIKLKLKYPFTKVVCISSTTSPASYLFHAQRVYEFYPNYKFTPSLVIKKITYRVAMSKGCQLATIDNPWQFKVKPTIPNIGRFKRIPDNSSPHYEYYKSINPNFYSGKGIRVYVPLTTFNFLASSFINIKLLLTKNV